ncbi:Uncharacterised protein [Vibrio cholerae]|nr:Uncharacterised protein [Vibrio cholerae]
MQAKVAQNRTDFAVTLLTIRTDNGHLLVWFYFTAFDTANTDNTYVRAVIELRNLHLQWTIKVNLWRRNVIHDGLEQRFHVLARFAFNQSCPTVQR